MKRLIYTLILALFAMVAVAENPVTHASDYVPGPVLTDSAAVARLMSWNQTATTKAAHDWAAIAAPIVSGCRTNMEKARVIYRWLCDNITYDYTYTIYDAATCYERRTGVCNAYSLLFCELAHAVGIKAYRVVGDAKTSREDPSATGLHAWVKVVLDEAGKFTILADPTWGAGHQADTWFNVDPSWMLFTHLPENPADQLVPDQLDKATFLTLPYIFAGIKILGIKGKPYLESYRNGRHIYIPSFSNSALRNDEKYTMPQTGTLCVGKTYNFVVTGNREPSCFGAGAQTNVMRRNRTWTLSVRPTEVGNLHINLGDNWVVTYKVERIQVSGR